jgi:hypothetical protein
MYYNPATGNYMETVAGKRALNLTEEEALAGNTLVSAETCLDHMVTTMERTILIHPETFFANLRFLSVSDQEVLLCYYLCGKTQTNIAKALIGGHTQTLVSSAIRQALAVYALYMLHQGFPPVSFLEKHFTRMKVETNSTGVPLSVIVATWATASGFSLDRVAGHLRIHPPKARQAIREAINVLREDPSRDNTMLLCHLLDLNDRSKRAKSGEDNTLAKPIKARTSGILGQFRVRAEDPDIDQLFTSRAIMSGPLEE